MAKEFYGGLTDEAVKELNEQAVRIQSWHRANTETVIEIGRALIEAKEKLKHGKFGAWVEAECGFTIRTAQNYMRAAKDKSENVSHLPCSPESKTGSQNSAPEETKAASLPAIKEPTEPVSASASSESAAEKSPALSVSATEEPSASSEPVAEESPEESPAPEPVAEESPASTEESPAPEPVAEESPASVSAEETTSESPQSPPLDLGSWSTASAQDRRNFINNIDARALWDAMSDEQRDEIANLAGQKSSLLAA